MPSFSSQTITSTCHEWTVPASAPWGAAAADIGKAWTAAERAYRAEHGLDPETPLADNALAFRPTDDHIVISFTIESLSEPTAAAHSLDRVRQLADLWFREARDPAFREAGRRIFGVIEGVEPNLPPATPTTPETTP
ncbi:hypothetical protein [Actinacidiphila glaucinigra]|uniref:hypothetical protein n=1 Tax=Actinacidiphila glaucinigra TaxID=235986 RepID=UPI0035D7526C